MTLYRAAGAAEVADISATGTYRIAGNSASGGKFFSNSFEQATSFVEKGWASRVTAATFPQNVVDAAERLQLAGEGPALYIPSEYFPYGPVTIH